MAANINLNSVPSAGSRQAAFPWNPFNVSKNGEWVSQAAQTTALAAIIYTGILYTCYNLYKAAQLKFRTICVLDSHTKYVKCQALLQVAGQVGIDPTTKHSLLQQCESLLSSIPIKQQNRTFDRLWEDLIQCSAESNSLDITYQRALELSSVEGLFSVVRSVRTRYPNFDPEDTLVQRAFEQWLQEVKTSQASAQDMDRLLRVLAGAFHGLGTTTPNVMHKAVRILDDAKEVILQSPLSAKDQVKALGTLIACRQALGGNEELLQMLSQVVHLCATKGAEQISAHLHYMKTLYSLGKDDLLQVELSVIRGLLFKAPTLCMLRDFDHCLRFKADISRDMAQGRQNELFPLFNKITEVLQPRLQKAPQYLSFAEGCSPFEKAQGYLTLWCICQNCFSDAAADNEFIANEAINAIRQLPEATEKQMNEKVDWLWPITIDLCRREDVHAAIKMQMVGELESLYDRATELTQDRWRIGGKILACYEFMGEHAKAAAFYNKLMEDVCKGPDGVVQPNSVRNERVCEIVRSSTAHFLNHDASNSPAYNALFVAAQHTLSLLDALAVKQIARGYIAINQGQKAIDILNAHEQVARPHLMRAHMIHAIATACFMGACWFSPHLVTLTAMTVAVTASIVSAVSCIKWCMTKKQQESDEQHSHCRT